MNLHSYLKEKKTIIDNSLKTCFSETAGLASDVVIAMKYSLMPGGKRLRPILCMAGCEAVGGDIQKDIISVACAIELIHTYSLIHDDLPALDDDDLRRGKPTNHMVFGEAIAILAGDGLLTEAFRLMTGAELMKHVSPRRLLRVIALIARAAGYQGMVGGQVVDIQSEGKEVDMSYVEYIHTHKTAALIEASITSGAILGKGSQSQIQAITIYGKKIGLAFQISDDLLDIDGDSQVMGKRAGADEKRKKITYPAVLGYRKSKEIQSELVKEADLALKGFDHSAEPLRQIAAYIIDRKK